MKILYIITKSGSGGAQTHVRQLSNKMISYGNEVAIISQPGNWGNIKFYPNKYLSNSFNLLKGYKAMKKIREVVSEFNPDIVHCHSSAAGFWGRLAIKGMTSTIFTAHGWGFTDGVPIYRKIIAEIAEKFVEKYCSKIICVSDYDRRLALNNFVTLKEKLITIHNGVEIEKYFLVKSNNEDKVSIVFVGRLDKQKDPETLLKAFSKLPNVTRNVSQIKIVGDGPKREKIERIIKENNLENNVQLLGNLSRRQVFEELKKADIFTLISHYEGFPITILEAMSFSLPIIASNVGGVSEAVDQRNGFVAARGDVDGVRSALEKLIEDAELRERMGEGSRKRAVEEFSLDQMIEKTVAVYAQLLRR